MICLSFGQLRRDRVDLFFVISGFIITFVARDDAGLRQGLRFRARRFIRINPMYYVASLLFLKAPLVKTATDIGLHVPSNLSFNPYTIGLLTSLKSTVLVVPPSTKSRRLHAGPLRLLDAGVRVALLRALLFLIVSGIPRKATGLLD
jgi:hypothetical protein